MLEANSLEHAVALLTKSPHELSIDDIGGDKLDALVAEPYFILTLLPWHSLYFWYVRTALSGLLSLEAVVMPYRAFLRAIPGSIIGHSEIKLVHVGGLTFAHFSMLFFFVFLVCFEHLHTLKSQVGTVEGFDLSAYDRAVCLLCICPAYCSMTPLQC